MVHRGGVHTHKSRLWCGINSPLSVQGPRREQPARGVEHSQPGQLPPKKIHLHRWGAKWGDNPSALGHAPATGEERDSSFLNHQRESRVPQHCEDLSAARADGAGEADRNHQAGAATRHGQEIRAGRVCEDKQDCRALGQHSWALPLFFLSPLPL